MKVLILAGGYGTRLYPLIKDTPKALLDIHGKPLIDYALAKFIGMPNVDEVVIVTNAKFNDILSAWAEKHNGKPFPVRVINDGTHTPEERLGAIGDIVFVLDQMNAAADWAVIGSDNLFDYGIAEFFPFAATRAPAVTIGCYDIHSIADASKYGVIELGKDGRNVSLEEKPAQPRSSLISMCLYYYPAGSLSLLRQFLKETGKKDTTGGYIQWLYQKTAVYGFKFDGKWYDIGSLESYKEAQDQFKQ
ncbi:MAG: nucleotidyltransferase family protein [Candidatus Omnitrophica bacterium]|nr:nucleotidyltransferase family protein [Candidatus Omnitrophota bacterium]